MTPALIVSISTIFYADKFFEKIYTGNTEGYEIFAILMNCFTAMSLTYIFGALLTATGKLKVYNMMAVGGIVLNLVLNFIVINQSFVVFTFNIRIFETVFFKIIMYVLISTSVFFQCI